MNVPFYGSDVEEEEKSLELDDPTFFEAIESVESGGRTDAVSNKGARGPMQIMPATWGDIAQEGESIDNPDDNRNAGKRYFNQLYKRYDGDVQLASAAYNAGMGNIDKYRKQGFKSWEDISEEMQRRGAFQETVDYVPKVMRSWDKVRGTSPQNSSQTAKLLEESDDPEVEDVETLDSSGFAKKMLPHTTSEEYNSKPLTERLKIISDTYAASQWDPDVYDTVKTLSDYEWDGASEEETPSFSEIPEIGKPPITDLTKSPEQDLKKWQEDVYQKVYETGVSPAVFGSRLDTYLQQQSERELEAFKRRQAGTSAVTWLGNTVREVGIGALTGYAKPIALVPRLMGDSELANMIEDAPAKLRGDSSDAYLYEVDKDGYLVENADGTYQTKVQGEISNIVGNIGSFLAGGVALKAAGWGSLKLGSFFFGTNVGQYANDSFRTVEEETGDKTKAYKAALASLPAATLDTVGDMLVAGKVMSPVLGGLSKYERLTYAAARFGRGGAITGTTSVASDAIQQSGEIAQTGRDFDTSRSAKVAIAGTIAGGVVDSTLSSVESVKNKKKELADYNLDLNKKSERVGKNNEILQKFRDNPDSETKLSARAEDIDPEILSQMGMKQSTDSEGNVVVTKDSDVLLDTALIEDLPIALQAIETLHTPSELLAAQRKLAELNSKQSAGKATEVEIDQIKELQEVTSGLHNPKHINNIKAYEGQVNRILENDPGALPVTWDAKSNRWHNIETGESSVFLKDALRSDSEFKADTKVYENDFSDTGAIKIIDEDELNYSPQDAADREADSVATQETIQKSIVDIRVEHNTLKTELRDKTKEKSKIELDNSKGVKDNIALEDDITKQKTAVEKAEKELANYKEIPKKAIGATDRLAKLRKELEDEKAGILKLTNKLSKAKSDGYKTSLEEKISTAKNRERDLKAEMLGLRENSRLEATKSKRQKAQERLQSEQNKLKELSEKSKYITQEVPDLSNIENTLKELDQKHGELMGAFETSREDHAKLKTANKSSEKAFKDGQKAIAKVRKKGLAAIITDRDGETIVIPSGLSPEVKQQVVAHELGHSVANKVSLPADLLEKVESTLGAYDATGFITTVGEVSKDLLLPEVQKVTGMKSGETLNELQKGSRKSLLSVPEYMANQIGAEILRRAGVNVDQIKIDPDIALWLQDKKLPDIGSKEAGKEAKILEESKPIREEPTVTKEPTVQTKSIDEFTDTVAASRDPQVSQDAGIPDSDSTKPKLEFDVYTGERKQTAASSRASDLSKNAPVVDYPTMSASKTQEAMSDLVQAESFEKIKSLISPENNDIDGSLKPNLAVALFKKAAADYEADPTPSNLSRMEEAFNLSLSTPTIYAQAIGTLRGAYDLDSYAGFIKSVSDSLKKSLGSKYKPLTEFALRELKSIYDEAKKAGYGPGSIRNDYVNEGIIKVLDSQGIDQKAWVQEFVRTNLLTGFGTFQINALGGAVMGPIATLGRALTTGNPTVFFKVLSGMAGAGRIAGAADFVRTMNGKQAALLLDHIGNASQFTIKDKSTTLRKIQSKLNTGLLFARKLMSATDAFNRRIASQGYMAQESHYKLNKLYGNDPARYMAEAAKIYFGKGEIQTEMKKMQEASAKNGVELSNSDAAIYAYENLLKTGYSNEAFAPILEKAENWADITSLRGKLSNPALDMLNTMFNRGMSHWFGGPALTAVLPFGRSIMAIADYGYDVIPGTYIGKKAESIVMKKAIMQDSSTTPDVKRRKIHQLEVEEQRSLALNKLGAGLAATLLGAALEGSIEIEGEASEVLDLNPKQGESPIGKAARDRTAFKEYDQTGKNPYSIKFKGSKNGFIYKDYPGLNAVIYGVHKAKQAIDKGADPMDAAMSFYKGAFAQISNVTLLEPYTKLFNNLIKDDTGDSGTALEKSFKDLGRTAVSMSVPFSGLIKDINKSFDGNIQESNTGSWATIFKDYPGSKELFGSNPALDDFGRPVEKSLVERVPGVGRFIASEKEPSNETARMLKEKGIITPSNPTTIRFTTADYSRAGTTKDKYKTTAEERVGKSLSNAFTPDEWYDFIKYTGPHIERAARRVASSGSSTAVSQQRYIKDVKTIRNNAKKQFIRNGRFGS